jgi:hypothetical protein
MDSKLKFTPEQDAFVAAYMAQRKGQEMNLDRLVTTPSGLGPEQMMMALAHPDLEDRGLEVMADYMRPQDSMYFDAIFGANYGQKDVRGWLLPTMAEIAFIEFVPQQDSVVFDTPAGGAMIDEWKMVAKLDGMEIPLADGISLRRFEDGWLTWVADIYDTTSSRTPPPADAVLPEGMPEQAPLPDYPEMNWPSVDPGPGPAVTDAASSWVKTRISAQHSFQNEMSDLSHDELHAILLDPELGRNVNLLADMLHPSASVFIDPVFGRLEGQQAVRDWLVDIQPKKGELTLEPIAETWWDGNTSVQQWKQMAVLPDGSKVEMTWGASVRRFKDGWLVYCADYYDAFSLQRPAVIAASQSAGSTLTLEDVARYRPELLQL